MKLNNFISNSIKKKKKKLLRNKLVLKFMWTQISQNNLAMNKVGELTLPNSKLTIKLQ